MALLLLLLILAVVGDSEDATWCICNSGLSTTAYQLALDYACGNGADCGPIQTNGNCFLPNDVQSHCSYAANSYFQSKGQATGTCNFSGTATVTQTDPSPGGSSSCTYPSTSSNTAPTSPGTSPGFVLTPPATNPTTFAPPGFVLTPPAFGPTGIPIGFDGSGINGKNLVSMTRTPIFMSIASSWIFFYVYLRR